MARQSAEPRLEFSRPDDGRRQGGPSTPPSQPPPLLPTATTLSSAVAGRVFGVAGLLLISGWALSGSGGPLLASAAVFNGFGTPPCACRPHHPLHPQIAFCASDFVLKVRFLRMVGEQKNSLGHYEHYWVHVKQVFRNSLQIPSLLPNRRMSLWIYGDNDNCGRGITVRHYNETQSMISGGVQMKKIYLVSGKVEDGRLMLSICSWIAYWPNRKARKALPAVELVSAVVTVQQARYLRHGRYAKGCSKCKIVDTLFQSVANATRTGTSCSFDPATDYYMCLASYSYCAHYSDPYSRTSGCAWHTASQDRFGRCATENIKLKAQREGIEG